MISLDYCKYILLQVIVNVRLMLSIMMWPKVINWVKIKKTRLQNAWYPNQSLYYVIILDWSKVITLSNFYRTLKMQLNVTNLGINKGRFHQHFTSSFYVHRSQKCKKTLVTTQSFAIFGSSCTKAAHKHVGEIDPRMWQLN